MGAVLAGHERVNRLPRHAEVRRDLLAKAERVEKSAHADHAPPAEMLGEQRDGKLVGIGNADDDLVAVAVRGDGLRVLLVDRRIPFRQGVAAERLAGSGRRKGGAGRHDDQIGAELPWIENDFDSGRDLGVGVGQIRGQSVDTPAARSARVSDEHESASARQQPFDENLLDHLSPYIAARADDRDVHELSFALPPS